MTRILKKRRLHPIRLKEARAREERPSSIPVTEALVFDGRIYAAEREKLLKIKIEELATMNIKPHLAVIMTSKDEASALYVKLKQKAAARVGIEMEVYHATANQRDYKYVLNLLAVLNRDPKVHGIMIQLPLGRRYEPYRDKLLESISPIKDVDGLRAESLYVPATIKGIIEIIKEAQRQVLMINPPHVFVIGSEGAVGRALIKHLTSAGYPVKGYDVKKFADWRDLWGIPSFMSLKADIVISATGVPGVLEARHVNRGAVVIDVGSPKGDARFKEIKQKAAFITPVPGGVGPMTIVSLLENVVLAAYNSQDENTHLEGTLS